MEKPYRRVWQEVSAGEFEAEDHNSHINEFRQQHRHCTTPYDFIDNNRLDSTTPFTTPFTTPDIKQVIKNMKISSPGSSGINKTILKNLPDNAINRLTLISNSSFAADYPPIPIHTLSKTQLKKLQITQNKALRFATNQRYPYTMNTREIHEYTNTISVNIRLHQRPITTWEKLELLENQHFSRLKDNIENIRKFNTRFPSSLLSVARENEPNPIYN
ncbi:hypothetical protein E2C01_035088 [Portunus trituberculatus]|uniref:Uncharacterized protein n=1 Tax=Portunus trituberculatus TaxID=210409 RepID=A0A5B7F7D6_PORTR|nr:hypothetical protein [Portunus trituberculatus]